MDLLAYSRGYQIEIEATHLQIWCASWHGHSEFVITVAQFSIDIAL